MNRVSRRIGVLAVIVLAACADAEPEARGAAVQPAPAAAEGGEGYTASASLPAEAAAEPEVAPSAGAEELAMGVATPAERPAASPTPAPAAPPPAEAPAATETAPDAAAVLARAERAYDQIRSLEADFSQAVTVPLLESTQHSRGKLYIRRPDRFLMKFSQPEGDIVVADGSYFWMYYPSADAKQVMRASIGDGSRQVDLQKEFLSDPTARYHAVLDGVEPVAGRPADVVALTPKGPSGYRRVRIWVDRGDALVRRFEIVEENESVRLLELTALKPNGTLSDQLFHFTPPPGTQVFTQP